MRGAGFHQRRTAAAAAILLATALGAEPSVARSAPREPVDVGGAAQIFVDRHLVADATGVTFVVQPAEKHPANPLIVPDQPWEKAVYLFGDVVFDADERRFKMWYTARPPEGSFSYEGQGITAHVVCYATSRDGVRWEKPPVGTLESPVFERHNAVAPVQSPVVWKDARDPDPRRRYKMVGVSRLATETKPKHPTCTFVSPDGFRWTHVGHDIHGGTQDVVNGFVDERRGLYTAIPKRWPYPKVDGRPRRVFGVMASRDFVEWARPQWVFAADAADVASARAKLDRVRIHFEYPDNPYRNLRADIQGVSAYPHESGVVVTFPWVFSYFRGFEEPKELRDEGVIELQVGTLRAGPDGTYAWDRSLREPILPHGAWGEWDSGFLFAAAKAVRVGDEVLLFYDGGNWTHGFNPKWFDEPRTVTWDGRTHTWTYRRAIGLATWQADRFVAARAPAEGGELTTVPVQFDAAAARLEVNADVRPGGSLVVELCDASGRPLAGFERSDVVTGDGLRQTVTFAGRADVAPLRGRPLVLRFHLADADLFSFAFRRRVEGGQ